MSSLSTPLLTQTLESADASLVRRGEPVSCGVPWPSGALADPRQLRLFDSQNRERPLQTRTLDRWPDGSVRWVLLDWLADSAEPLSVAVLDSHRESGAGSLLQVVEKETGITITTGTSVFEMKVGGLFPFGSVETDGREALDTRRSGLAARDDADLKYRAETSAIEIEDSGPVRASVLVSGRLHAPGGSDLLELKARLHFYAGSSTVRLDLTFTNRRRAGHPGGIWTLGQDGSVQLRSLWLSLALPAEAQSGSLELSTEHGKSFETVESPVVLHQASSGGENWRSRAHLDRNGDLPLEFRGYRVRTGVSESSGDRATPIVAIEYESTRIALAVPEFWQNFPQALEASGKGLILRLLPENVGHTHELQGGEAKTYSLTVTFGPDRVTKEPLAWVRDPTIAHTSPEWVAETRVLPLLTPKSEDRNQAYLALVDQALEGPDTLERKREAVDEYGWRHFGDVWADHEAARDEGDTPLISHYNNQYDMVGGFAVQFLRSADGRWHRYMRQLARHVADIDLYHTDRDKSAYNGGMFWHTVHYIDAGTSTHRSYPAADGVSGGGPSTGQLYSAGLWLHYLMTGDRDSREAVVGVGDYVVNADDGSLTIFRFLDRGFTGHVSNSGFDDYHGPGRGSANAIAALVQAHRATSDDRYLTKAEQLVRRSIHPADDIESLDLLDADRKWFYTMFLQSLGDYLEYKIELDQIESSFAYGRAALLHYADWAADHEYPYLERPEILEFPTETWAAQDIRKSEVFRIAARFSESAQQERYLEKARFFFDASVNRLTTEPTASFTRPLALMLSHGWRQQALDSGELTAATQPRISPDSDFGAPEVFVSQKRRAIARGKRILIWTWAVAMLGIGVTLAFLWLG